MELLGSDLIFTSLAQFFLLPLLGFLPHCSCSPLSRPCALAGLPAAWENRRDGARAAEW